jgi:transposase
MLYMGIDLHRKQMTVSVRNEVGNVILHRQVSTRWDRLEEFLQQLHHQGGMQDWARFVESSEQNRPVPFSADSSWIGSYVVMVEVCGFEDWLVKRLEADARCNQVIVVQPLERSKQKTDRRDAKKLSELLWVNRERLLRGDRVHGVRVVRQPTEAEREDRQLTQARIRVVRKRTQTVNQIRKVLRRNNLEWDRPTKTFQTKQVRQWLQTLELGVVERLLMDQLLAQWDMWDHQIGELDKLIKLRFERNEDAKLLATIVGVSRFMALAIACRIGPIDRFPSGRSLANFLGLTPRCRSTGETERLGSITKEGSAIVRFLLAQAVVHVLRSDGQMREWYKRIKRRRGSKIARVAVMRRMAVIIWHMLTKREGWRPGGFAQGSRPSMNDPSMACIAPDPSEVLKGVLDEKSKPTDHVEGTTESTGASSRAP